jgi:predicted dehydrogenase
LNDGIEKRKAQRKPLVTGEDGLRALELALAALASMEQGRKVEIGG